MKTFKNYINEASTINDANELNDLLIKCIRTHSKQRCIDVLNLGANANGIRSNNEDIPLHTAAYIGNGPIVKLLLNNGADIKRRNHYEDTALHEAVYGNHPDVCEILLEHDESANLLQNDDGFAPIHAAVQRGHIECVETLLDNGVNIEEKDGEGDTPLMVAIWYNKMDAIAMLLDHGANIEALNNDGYTPLIQAVRKADKKVIQLLIDKGAKIDYETRDEARGSWPNYKPKYELTHLPEERPLSVARWKGDADIARFLIELGADPMKDFEGVDDMIELFGEGATWLAKYLPEGPEKASFERSSKSNRLFGI